MCVISYYRKSRGKGSQSATQHDHLYLAPSTFLLCQLSIRTWSLMLALPVSEKVTISKHPPNTLLKMGLF